MAVPEGLIIAGGIVGLAGGVLGIVTATDNVVTRIRRARQGKRDAEMRLRAEFRGVEGFPGPPGRSYPIATARLHNNGKIPAKDIVVSASTGWASIDTGLLAPDKYATVTFAMRDVHEVDMGGGAYERQPVDVPYRVGPVELSVTWRIDGTTDRSQPVKFAHSYGAEGFE